MQKINIKLAHQGLWALALVASGSGSAWAERGVVVVDGADSVAVFDTATNRVTSTASTGSGDLDGDCALSNDGSKVYVTEFSGANLRAIDIPSGTVSAIIPVSNYAEAVSLTADGNYAVVTNGGTGNPVSVVSTASNAEVSTLGLGGSTTNDICDSGTVLTANFGARVERNSISAGGVLTNQLSGAQSIAHNLACAAGSKTFIALDPSNASLKSYSVQTLAQLGELANVAFDGSVAFSPDSRTAYVRGYNGAVLAYPYDPATGAFGGLLWAQPVAERLTYFGINQLAVAGNGNVYVPENGNVKVLGGATGALVANIPVSGDTTGICFARRSATPPATIMSTSYSAAPVAEGPAGTYRINARLCNVTSDTHSNFAQRVNTLTNNNNLISRTGDAASGRAGGPGATQLAPRVDGNADGLMAPNECVNETDVLGLTSKSKFTFTVDLIGTPVP